MLKSCHNFLRVVSSLRKEDSKQNKLSSFFSEVCKNFGRNEFSFNRKKLGSHVSEHFFSWGMKSRNLGRSESRPNRTCGCWLLLLLPLLMLLLLPNLNKVELADKEFVVISFLAFTLQSKLTLFCSFVIYWICKLYLFYIFIFSDC